MKVLKITISDETAEKYQLSDSEALQVETITEGLLLVNEHHRTDVQKISLRWYLLPTLLLTSLFLLGQLKLGNHQVLLNGDQSIASFVLALGLSGGLVSFLYFFIRGKRQAIETNTKDIYWRNLPAIFVALAIIGFLAISLFFRMMRLVFLGASFDLFTATVLFALFDAIINYTLIFVALSLTPRFLTNLLTVTIFGGVMLAMALNSDNYWWQYNFSFLGTYEATNSWQFNLTLILAALLMIALLDFLFVRIERFYPKNIRLRILRVLLTLTAITLGGVGLFPYTETGPFVGVHNQVAAMLIYLMIILMAGIKWLLPAGNDEFIVTSYVIGVLLVVISILFQNIHYLSLTAFELLAFILAFAWIILVLQNLQKLAAGPKETSATITLTDVKDGNTD